MSKIKYFEHNTEGIDYVIGDIHGCYDEVLLLLEHVNFNKLTDRLFSVGDLVDRGPKSIESLKLIYEPWFHAVLANHEDMMIRGIVHEDKNMLDGWRYNGGDSWYQKISKKDLFDMSVDAEKLLPFVIVIGKDSAKRINIVHAEFYKTRDDDFVTDTDIDDWCFDNWQEDNLIWGRSFAENKQLFNNNPKYINNGLSTTYCGHTPQQSPIEIMHHRIIDTGAVYWHTQILDRNLTMVRILDDTIFLLDMRTKEVTESKFITKDYNVN